jgi:hypothetical protein
VSPPDLVSLFVAPLNKVGARYMVSGAIAAIIYGEPRLTNDIDVVVDLDVRTAHNLLSAFDPAAFYVPPREAVEEEIGRARGGHFNVIHPETALKLDVYPAGAERLNTWGLANRRRMMVNEHTLWIAPPEYVVLLKLQYWHDGDSGKHATDIRAMLRTLAGDIDSTLIEREATSRGLSKEWDAVRDVHE